MKRQGEELIFKYKTKPQKLAEGGILFEFPLKYNPLPGDIIEMIISEGDNLAQVDYYAHLVCFNSIDENDTGKYVSVLNGSIENENGVMVDLVRSVLMPHGDGYAIELYVEWNDESSIPPFVGQSECIVNLIVHRSKSKIKLYYF